MSGAELQNFLKLFMAKSGVLENYFLVPHNRILGVMAWEISSMESHGRCDRYYRKFTTCFSKSKEDGTL
jgi:hypothetical protein